VSARPEPTLSATARARLSATAYASFVLLGWSMLLVPALIRSIEADFARSDAQLGLYYFVSAASFGIGALGGGFATERVGRRSLLAGAALLVAVGTAVQGLTPEWLVFVLAAVPAGIGSGVIDGGMNALVLDLAKRGSGGALNLLHLFFSIGAAVSPLVVGQVVSAGLDWRTIFLGTAVVPVVIGAMFALQPMPSGRHRPLPAGPELPRTDGPAPVARSTRLPMALLGLAIVFYVSTEIGTSSWLVRFLADASTDAATMTLAAFWAGLAVSRLLGSRYADRFPPAGFTATCAAAATLALFAAVIVPWLPMSMVLFAITGLAFGPIYPMIMSIGGSLYPRRRAAVTGSLATVAVVGSTVYPPVMGFIADAASVGLAMLGAAALAAACGAALVAAGAATRRAG
jgi:MFS transporter, FHS family, glucose/mannose:H+ symporter